MLNAQVSFVEAGAAAGVDHGYGAGFAGGGVSFCDFNGDGWDDLTLASQAGDSLHFYINEQGFFSKIPALVPNTDETKQVLWVDFDNDGDPDLFVTAIDGPNRLYENQGDLNLIDITEAAGLPMENHESYGACWGDVNRDGRLDLYVTERALQFSTNRNFLYLNNGDRTFTEIGEAAGVDDPQKAAFCSAFFDFNNDQWPDLYTAHDKTQGNTLLHNNADLSFSNISAEAGAGLVMNAMSVTIGDYNCDGWQDVYISNTPDGNRLLRNNGDETFTEVSEATGTTFNGIGWSAQFFDADNDGFEDLYVSGMSVGSELISSAFYRNNGQGAFDQPDTGMVADTVSSFGNATGDFNNDGRPDLMVSNTEAFVSHLWENQSEGGNWLKLDLTGLISNRDGVGARVQVFTGDHVQMREKHCGMGYLGQNSAVLHFGLGGATMADSIEVTWPTGHIDRLYEVSANQLVALAEGGTTGGEIYVDPGTGVTDTEDPATEAGPLARVFPNPAGGALWIECPEGPADLWLTDSHGRTMLTIDHALGTIRLQTEHYSPGVYYLQVQNQNRVETHRLIISD